MPAFDDKTGKKFNMLTAIEYLGHSKWKCRCDCGNYTEVYSAHLNKIPGRLKVKSCGCLREKNKPEQEDFFSKINSEEKAYILGFIAGDGCIQPELKRIKIDLKRTDKDILEKIQKAIGHTNELSFYEQEAIIKDKTYHSKIARLVISCEKWVEDLEKFGVVKAKSENMDFKINLIPKEFWKDVLRGFIDSDGSISYSPNSKSKTTNLTITTSDITAHTLNQMFIEIFGESKFYFEHRNPEQDYNTTLQATNKKFIKATLEEIYGNASIYLDRKYKKYKEVVSFIESLQL